MTASRVARTYVTLSFLFTLSMALIWGVNTLFLMHAGLSLFQVMLANAAFTFGSMVFEIPTGVVADTLGRRVSLLLCLATLFITTLAYLWLAYVHAGLWPFAGVSILLGLGFTFYTGAADAWLVDAMHHLAPGTPLDPIFSRGQMATLLAMLLGTLAGGLLGQLSLFAPYALRALLIVPTFLIASRLMQELGFTPRALSLRRVPAEMRRILVAGLRYGLRHPVVRPVMFASLVQGIFSMFAFYSWQPFFLQLLGKQLIWVSGVIASLVALAGIAGNALVGPLSRRLRARTSLLIGATVLMCASAIAAGAVHRFYPTVALFLIHCVAQGVLNPIKQSYLNAHLPSEQRATLISLDSLFGDAGAAGGQSGLGYLADRRSVGVAWTVGGALLILATPFYALARRRDTQLDSFVRPTAS